MGDSNMDETIGVDEPQMQYNQDDDDSGQDDNGADYGMEVDEPVPQRTPRAQGRKPEAVVDEPAQDDYDQNDHGNDEQMDDADSQQDEREPSESPKTKKARQKREARERERETKKENRAPLRAKDTNVPTKKRVRKEYAACTSYPSGTDSSCR